MISLLAGDMRTALDYARRAHDSGKLSGYFRSYVGSLIDQAHVLHATGDL